MSVNEKNLREVLTKNRKHIVNPVYRNKAKLLCREKLENGSDVLIEADGSLLCLETKFFVHKYEWDTKKQDFTRVLPSGKRKGQHDHEDAAVSPEDIKELVTAEE